MDEKKPTEEEELLDLTDFDEEDDGKTIVSDNESEPEEEEEVEPTSKKSQDEEEKEEKAKKNAHFAELRRRREAEEKEKERKIREEATIQAELGLLKRNPYTEEPITDAEDIKIYKIQKELDDEGKDPITDLPKRLAEINRKAIAEEKAKAEKEIAAKREQDDKISAEIKELREKYPKVDTAKLASDEIFKECLKGRAGRWSQTEIYELYLVKKAEADKKAEEEKTKSLVDKSAKKVTSTPTSTASGKISASSIADMSDEEFAKYWEEKYGK